MNVIGFSHRYFKLRGQESGTLISAEEAEVGEDFPEEGLLYDTSWSGGRYDLKPGRYARLVFLGNLRIPFTTYREIPEGGIRKYRDLEGEEFAFKFPGEPLKAEFRDRLTEDSVRIYA